jgi:soluble lytic murein transglycosylase-like protein
MRQRALLYEPYIAAAARRYGVDPRVLWTLAYLETRFRPDQVSPKGARGMLQFIPSTAARFNLANPFDAIQSIDAAARYVAELTKQFNGRLDLVLAAYNSGEGAVDCYLNGKSLRKSDGHFINPRGIKTSGVPPYSETQAYVRRGVLVFARVTSASVFSPELVASTRMLQAPAVPVLVSEQTAIDRELVALGGSQPAVLFSPKAAATLASVNPAAVQAVAYQEVFFDVHSGARYLVQSGEIVKPLERVSDEPAESGVNAPRKDVSKSVYLGSRED